MIAMIAAIEHRSACRSSSSTTARSLEEVSEGFWFVPLDEERLRVQLYSLWGELLTPKMLDGVLDFLSCGNDAPWPRAFCTTCEPAVCLGRSGCERGPACRSRYRAARASDGGTALTEVFEMTPRRMRRRRVIRSRSAHQPGSAMLQSTVPATTLPPTFHEAGMRRFARDWLAFARASMPGLGDPFDHEAMHRLVRASLKELADWHERNAARIVDLALAGFEDAHDGLMDLIAERSASSVPLGGALSTYVNILGSRPPRHRMPRHRPRQSFLRELRRRGFRHRIKAAIPRAAAAAQHHRRASVFSLISETLIEAGLGRGSEEAIRKIWRDYGPPVVPGYHYPP